MDRRIEKCGGCGYEAWDGRVRSDEARGACGDMEACSAGSHEVSEGEGACGVVSANG